MQKHKQSQGSQLYNSIYKAFRPLQNTPQPFSHTITHYNTLPPHEKIHIIQSVKRLDFLKKQDTNSTDEDCLNAVRHGVGGQVSSAVCANLSQLL